MNDDPKAFLPTTADALLAAGTAYEEAVPLAAIRIDADILRRETWSREVELSSALYDRYATGMPIEPTAFADKTYKLVDREQPVKKGKCTACSLFGGKELCVHCGARKPAALEPPCAYCSEGFIVCRVCDGTKSAVRATLKLVNDRAVVFHRIVVPSQCDAHASAIERLVGSERAPPVALRFELQANVVESAYRGASAVREPEFHAHKFDDALPRALAAMKDVARYRDAVKTEVRTYAWPLLFLRLHGRVLVLVKDASGNSHLV